MRQIATAPHECEGNLIFTENGLSPYWILGRLLIQRFDGYSGEIETEVDGEEWTINLKYQKSGIAPRLQNDVANERLYEYRISGYGRGERKANFLIQPRFADMRHYETGDQVSTPFDNIPEDEGINVRFAGSNLEPLKFRHLLPTLVQVLAREGGLPINTDYFAGEVHGMSNITTYERYVRLNRSWSAIARVTHFRRSEPTPAHQLDRYLTLPSALSSSSLQPVQFTGRKPALRHVIAVVDTNYNRISQ